ncbi:N-acetylmuramoyl-L-alanine amidase [uncultured Nonlabens sp.]|jgi:N-acetylmuramoyl-L-alanine amidase|uniref:N-acetylmuramoyl-L-alanine amidase n=1 Tax=uncultured Nonlabens sp. TaxID=859306 RepID=UPI0030DAE75B|tara:strand:- start:1291 stop:2376 length:1086 start_codon:yes stop_codon:yes gene_type:complete
MKTKIYLIIVLLSIPIVSMANIPIDSTKVTDKKVFTVVLDAGHGGKDSGKYVAQTAEKDIALKVVKLLGKQLESHTEIKVVYTRTTDKFLELYQRADIANNSKADLFVSVHCNAAAATAAKGNETWVLGIHRNADNLEVVQRENSVILLEENYKEKYVGFDPNDPSSFATNLMIQEEYLDNSIEMGTNVQSRFQTQLSRKNRGVKQAGFAVLRLSYMPSVLIETGFLTNEEERTFLRSTSGQKKVANSIYVAVLDYQKNREINLFEVEQVVTSETSTAAAVGNNIVYKVQISASSNKLEAQSYNFKSLPEISREKEGGIYRYFTGNFSSLKEVSELKEKAIAKGYTSAFIVIYEKGERRRL